MKIREIVINISFLPRGGITLYPLIIYNITDKKPSERLRKHEMYHVKQVERMGWLTFYSLYIRYWMEYGYEDHPFEIEARNNE